MKLVWLTVVPLLLGACGQIADAQMDSITTKVATDAEEQYSMTQRSGTKIDICVQAMSVSAAWLQAKNNEKYDAAKAIEKSDCAAAGMPAGQ